MKRTLAAFLLVAFAPAVISAVRPTASRQTAPVTDAAFAQAQIGDIILFRREGLNGAAQTLAWGGYWTHAQIVVDIVETTVWVAEATPTAFPFGQVIARPLHRTGAWKAVDAVILRVRADAQSRDTAHWFAVSQIGKPFSWALFDKQRTDAFYCSQLIWAAYAHTGGVDLDSNHSGSALLWRAAALSGFRAPMLVGGRAVTPDDIYFSPRVEVLSRATTSPARAFARQLNWLIGPADLAALAILAAGSVAFQVRRQLSDLAARRTR